MNFISEKRKFQSLSSVLNQKEANQYLDLIKFIDLLFDEHENVEDFEKTFSEILSFIYISDEKAEFTPYFLYSLLLYFLIIRSKNINFFTNFLDFIITKNSQQKEIYLNSFHLAYKDFLIKSPRFSFIIELIPESYKKEEIGEEEEDENAIQFYDPLIADLKEIIRKDDSDLLLKFISEFPDFSKDMKIDSEEDHFINVFDKSYSKVNLLDYCAFQGSLNCFKLLQVNGCDIGLYASSMAIAGGNLFIINLLEQMSRSFDSCFKISIFYHRFDISEWLLSNYRCETFPQEDCIAMYDYKCYLFFLLNDIQE